MLRGDGGYGATSSAPPVGREDAPVEDRLPVSTGPGEAGAGARAMPGTDVDLADVDLADAELVDVELADAVRERARPGSEAEDAEPVCRICHDDLSASPGHPVTLKCACKGGLRAAHARCALRWFRSRGDAVCEVCNQHTGLSLAREADRARPRAPGARGARRVFSRDARRGGGGEDAADPSASDDDSGDFDTRSDDNTPTWLDRVDADDTRRRSESARDASRRAARALRATRRGALYRFFCGPILASTADPRVAPLGGPDVETGSEASSGTRRGGVRRQSPRRDREVEGGVAICDLAPLLAAVFVSQTLLLLSNAGDADPGGAAPVVTPGLAVALAYMNSGAHLLGIVQMLVLMSVARLSRAKQVAVLWLWAAALGVGAWASFRRFMLPGGVAARGNDAATGEGEGALVACVIVSVSAAVSPALAFWAVCLARACRAGCGEGE